MSQVIQSAISKAENLENSLKNSLLFLKSKVKNPSKSSGQYLKANELTPTTISLPSLKVENTNELLMSSSYVVSKDVNIHRQNDFLAQFDLDNIKNKHFENLVSPKNSNSKYQDNQKITYTQIKNNTSFQNKVVNFSKDGQQSSGQSFVSCDECQYSARDMWVLTRHVNS